MYNPLSKFQTLEGIISRRSLKNPFGRTWKSLSSTFLSAQSFFIVDYRGLLKGLCITPVKISNLSKVLLHFKQKSCQLFLIYWPPCCSFTLTGPPCFMKSNINFCFLWYGKRHSLFWTRSSWGRRGGKPDTWLIFRVGLDSWFLLLKFSNYLWGERMALYPFPKLEDQALQCPSMTSHYVHISQHFKGAPLNLSITRSLLPVRHITTLEGDFL